jgi:hypothetical protein
MSAELDADAAAAKAKEWAIVTKLQQQQQQQKAAKPPRADSLSAVLIQVCVRVHSAKHCLACMHVDCYAHVQAYAYACTGMLWLHCLTYSLVVNR